jgi:AAA+ superfamily predicted ATPase
VTVTVDREHTSAIGDVADALRAAGMQVDQVLEAAGMVTGTIDADAESALTDVEGVASVERALRFQLPPPDSPVQ